MSDECDWSEDPASVRASALLELALNFEHIKDRGVRAQVMRAMGLLNEGIERVVRPASKTKPAALLPLRGGRDD